MKIKAVLFDMDGVLVDAREWHFEALNRALELFGMSISRESHLSTFDGLPTRKKLEILSASRNLPRKLHDFINELKQSFTAEITYTKCKPVFQLRYALSLLKRDGYRLALCSNSIAETVDNMMRLSRLDSYMDVMISNEDVTHAKPHPEIYIKAMTTLGVSPAELLIVEDNEHGVKAATASGAHVMRVASPDDVSYDRLRLHIDALERKTA